MEKTDFKKYTKTELRAMLSMMTDLADKNKEEFCKMKTELAEHEKTIEKLKLALEFACNEILTTKGKKFPQVEFIKTTSNFFIQKANETMNLKQKLQLW